MTDDSWDAELVRQYVDALRTDIMKQPTSEIDAICHELYERQADAWHAIRRRLPSERDELHAAFGRAVCERLERCPAIGGQRRFSVKPDSYARVFRPDWHVLGVSEDELVIGLATSQQFLDRKYPGAHFRVKHAPRFRVPVREALEQIAGLKIPKRSQYTIHLKSNSRLPSVIQKPDSVTKWFTELKGLVDIVKALDSACGSITGAAAAGA